MQRCGWWLGLFVFVLALLQAQLLGGDQGAGVQWIWFNDGDPGRSAPVQTIYFRRTFTIDRPVQKVVDEGTLDITADNQFTVWVNGIEVGKGDDWRRVYRFDVMKLLVHGKNLVAVKAANTEASPAGLLVKLSYVPNGQDRRALASDKDWKAAQTASDDWFRPDFNDASWTPVKVIGPYGKAGPWRGVAWEGAGDDRFTVPEGFAVEQVARNPNPPDPFSLINLCFDARGRLLLSQERGPILLCSNPDSKGVHQSVKPYCDQVKNCQGMCWVRDALLLVGDGPQGTGLYRVRDTDGDDRTDQVQLLHRFRGGMGEHGPHAILHGPDDALYLVIGNHAWAHIGGDAAKNGPNPDRVASNSPLTRWPTGHFGPDQGRPDTTEDVLLPRLNDSRGHAANILAPGGTIWRLDHEGKNFALVACGFRNQFDAAFSPAGELFTFDSDMEWDEGLPWYRAVRVCHCPPGADFVWRTGAANTPDYYLDSLPPLVETGRGSPVGVEFYDHVAFPENYRGAFFVADWSIGVIYAILTKRDGASYKGVAERFCVGAPMNVTDVAVGPEGALYFTLGGRGTQGGIYRIVHTRSASQAGEQHNLTPGLAGMIDQPQPLAPWARQNLDNLWTRSPEAVKTEKLRSAILAPGSAGDRIRLLNVWLQHRAPAGKDSDMLTGLARDKDPEVRAHAVWLLGLVDVPNRKEILLASVGDKDALVRRRACEALIRAGIEPPVEAIWPLLGDSDRFLVHAARLVLERIDPQKWTNRLWDEKDDRIGMHGIVALCHMNQAIPHTAKIFDYLHNHTPTSDALAQLAYLRTVELALIHTTARPGSVRGIALDCYEQFPSKDWRVNRELAILLTQFRREKILDEPVHARLLDGLIKGGNDRMQQIHYFYCMRLLHEGWTPQQKAQLLAWFDGTKTWTGGHSYVPFLENILGDLRPIITAEDRRAVFAEAGKYPWAAALMLRFATPEQKPSSAELAKMYANLGKAGPGPKVSELKEAIVSSLLRDAGKPEVQTLLREIVAGDPGQRDVVARILAKNPTPENWDAIVQGLQGTNPEALVEIIQALRKIPKKAAISKEPTSAEAVPYRQVLMASSRLPAKDRWKAVQLLRHWNDKKFTPEDGNWKGELDAWSHWFVQTFPKEPPLPNVTALAPQSKWKFDELVAFLETDPKGRNGDPVRGRAVFEKANCIKCHKFGSIGEGLGPDLTTLKSRFKRSDVVDSILQPSKVISDQYRGTKILTKEGQTITGLAAPQGDTITVLQLDGTKVTLKAADVDVQVASTISPMPEKLLDELTQQEIADLFAFLDAAPPK